MAFITISELFVSIQGEGVGVGAPSFFVRTSGCSVGCKYCDTKYAWGKGREWKVEDVIKEVLNSKLPEVVITGGEPLEQTNLPFLIEAISSIDSIRKITLETSGHIFRKGLYFQKLRIVLSPKPPTMEVKFPEYSLKKFLSTYKNIYLKFAVYDERDLDVVKGFICKNEELITEPIVIQPLQVPFEEYTKTAKRVFQLVIEDKNFLNKFEVRIIPQIHKLIGLK